MLKNAQTGKHVYIITYKIGREYILLIVVEERISYL